MDQEPKLKISMILKGHYDNHYLSQKIFLQMSDIYLKNSLQQKNNEYDFKNPKDVIKYLLEQTISEIPQSNDQLLLIQNAIRLKFQLLKVSLMQILKQLQKEGKIDVAKHFDVDGTYIKPLIDNIGEKNSIDRKISKWLDVIKLVINLEITNIQNFSNSLFDQASEEAKQQKPSFDRLFKKKYKHKVGNIINVIELLQKHINNGNPNTIMLFQEQQCLFKYKDANQEYIQQDLEKLIDEKQTNLYKLILSQETYKDIQKGLNSDLIVQKIEIERFQYVIERPFSQPKYFVLVLGLRNRNYNELLKVFKKKVRLLQNFNKATKGFKTKQMILQNRFFKTSLLITFLPEKDLLQLMKQSRSIKKPQNRYYPNEKIDSILDNIHIVQPILSNSKQFTFDPQSNTLDLKLEDQIMAVDFMIKKCSFIDDNPINHENFANFISILQFYYNRRNNQFHNFLHGVTVMSGCFVLAHNKHFNLTPIEQFCLVFSGLCHDIDHTGRLNIFEQNSSSKLALKYNDRSILENHHSATTFKILSDEKLDLFHEYDKYTRNDIRKQVISNIMYTDNNTHFTLLHDIELHQATGFDTPQKKLLLTGFLIHSSDFYGAVKPYEISRKWSEKVKVEFQEQLAQEQEMSLPQTPFLKNLDDPKIFAKNETGFLKVIVLPLWQILNQISHGDFENEVHNLQSSIHTYEQLAQ